MNLFLDLDNTLIYSVSKQNRWHTKARPYLQTFLDYIFKNFNVSIWTAASESYARSVIDKFILIKPDRKIAYLLHDDHCDASMKYYGNLKDIRLLTQILKLPKINLNNTFLIDDLITSCEYQKKRCLNIFPYKGDDRDEELLLMIQTLKDLKRGYAATTTL